MLSPGKKACSNWATVPLTRRLRVSGELSSTAGRTLEHCGDRRNRLRIGAVIARQLLARQWLACAGLGQRRARQRDVDLDRSGWIGVAQPLSARRGGALAAWQWDVICHRPLSSA